MFNFIKKIFFKKVEAKEDFKPIRYLSELKINPFYVYEFNDWLGNKYGMGNVGRFDKFNIKYCIDEWMKEENAYFYYENGTEEAKFENEKHKNRLVKRVEENWNSNNSNNKKYFIRDEKERYLWYTIPNLKVAKETFDNIEWMLKYKNDFDCRAGFCIRSKSGKVYQLQDTKGNDIRYNK